MRNRSLFGALLMLAATIPFTSCSTTPALTSITINPGAVTTSMSPGLLVDFTAIGSYTRPGHAAVTKDITNEVTWTSAFPQFVVIGTDGVAAVTGYGYGIGNIYASAPGFHGVIVGSATFTIEKPTVTGGAVKNLSLLPSKTSGNGTIQFTALGRNDDSTSSRLTGHPTWVSTDNLVATIDKDSGILTVVGAGKTTITAVYTNPDGTTAVGKTSFTVAEDK